jgi:hypothetical protein
LEDLGARRADRLLICDTEAANTGLWHEVYLGRRADEVDAIGAGRKYALTLVTANDFPWVQDGFRTSPQARADQQRKVIERLEAQGEAYHLIGGDGADLRARVAQAAEIITGATGIAPSDEGKYWLELGLAGRWHYLRPRENSRRRSLFMAGRDLSACGLIDELLARRLDYETLAAELGLPVAAVREADWYSARHIELAYAEQLGDQENIASFTDAQCG